MQSLCLNVEALDAEGGVIGLDDTDDDSRRASEELRSVVPPGALQEALGFPDARQGLRRGRRGDRGGGISALIWGAASRPL